jgi:XTP/dITP diphosphohydrolase
MTPLVSIVLATQNHGKLAELRGLLADLPVELLSMRDVLGDGFSVPEDGETFEQNALTKAVAVCKAAHMPALADDSGLEVEALAGRPGVRSARFAHERATDAENNAALLRELEDFDDPQRSARFRCVLALATPWDDTPRTADGRCDGRIARTPRGSGGFGYDPLFVLADGRAMAELSEQEKNALSHRGRAMHALRPMLVELVKARLDETERILG